MTYTRNWDESQPQDHTKLSDVPLWMRVIKIDVAERLKDWIYGFISGETKIGLKKAPLHPVSSDPATESDKGILYVKEVNGVKELFYKDSAGNVKQLTLQGKLNLADESVVVIELPDNLGQTVWEKVGELRGESIAAGAELSFIVFGSEDYGRKGRQTLFVNAQQRGDNEIKVDVYSLENGEVTSLYRVKIGYVQVGTYDFDIYVKREPYNPCIIAGHDSAFNGFFITNPETLTSEPSGIVYVDVNKIWHSGNDGAGSGLDADLLRGLPADFTCSKSTSGYTKLPNGLILQWGIGDTATGGTAVSGSINFPISFPNSCFQVVASPVNQPNPNWGCVAFRISSVSTTSFSYAIDTMNTGQSISNNVQLRFIAIGY